MRPALLALAFGLFLTGTATIASAQPYPTRTEIGEISPWPVMAGEPVDVRVSVIGCLPPYLGGCGVLHGPVTISDASDPSTTCTTGVSDDLHCSLVFQSSGAHTIRADFAGSGPFGPSFDGRALTVGPRVFTLAEGIAGPFFDTYLLLANPGATPEPVTVTFWRDDGAAATMPVVVPPYARVTWKVDDIPPFGDAASSTTVTVPSGRPLIAERATYFATDYRAGHAAMGRTPSAHYFFAEGCQNGEFDTYVIIGNPSSEIAFAHVQFLVEGESPLVYLTYGVLPGTRLSIATAGIPELAGRSFGMVVGAHRPITVERSMYFGEGYVGGHGEAGVLRLSSTWLFAEGSTGPPFATFLLLANENSDQPAAVTAAFHLPGGETVNRPLVVPPDSRVTIDVAREDPRLAATTFWIEVLSDVPIVAERAMYWSATGGSSWTEGHVSAGAAAAGPRWGFAEGIVGGGLGFKTFLLLANPASSPATVDVQYLPTGGAPITRTHTVPADGRLTIDVETDVPALRDVPFGMVVTARDGAAIVAERSIYWTHGGPVFVGGTNVVGLPF